MKLLTTRTVGSCFLIRNLLFAAVALAAFPVGAQRQMERLGRGVVAVRTSSSQVYVGWRLLGTDPADLGFNLYRVANGVTTKLNTPLPLTNTTDYVDTPSSLAVANAYFVRPVLEGVEQPASAAFTLAANPPTRPYLEILLQPPAGGTTPDGVSYTYRPNDCSVGDLDGDGEYEIVLKWDPSNSKDNSQSGYTGDVFLDAYKLNGTRLWRIDLGKNIRAGAHYTQFIVYDLDGDGRAEVACRTAPGTVDGQGNYVLMPGDNPLADYRNSSGYILTGPEYLTIFEGLTGAELATTNFYPDRVNVSQWGDSYGNRVDRFLAAVAYVDGVRPSLIMARGYYPPQSAGGQARNEITAWNWRGGQLKMLWWFRAGQNINSNINRNYIGQGNHSLSIADVDEDGKDEIVYGACSIDDDGSGLYSTGLAHGDALHVSDMDPDHPGLEVWDVHEVPSSAGGGELRDARTGQLLFGYPGTGDTGRGMASHIDGRYRGYQLWSSATDGVYNRDGTRISTTKPSVNFAIWWDADLTRELLDSTRIDKWTGNGTTRLLSANNYGRAVSINGTKANPCLSADVLGDWREEVIYPSADSSRLLIFTTTIRATNRFYTFMQDPQYRLAIAWQNVAYNQPPHPSFYVGDDMFPLPVPPVSDATLLWRGGQSGNAWDAASTFNWVTNNIWTNDPEATVFSPGATVLFDVTGSNSQPVQLSGTLAPGEVTVYSPGDYVFDGPGALAGSMKLTKAGAGTLTLNSTNSYTGRTLIAEGTLVVNGSLDHSPVFISGNAWGGGIIGGTGRLGNGLTVLRGANLRPGDTRGVAGILTVTNGLTEPGGAVNEWDLSDDATGTAKASDRIDVIGDLNLSGTNTLKVNLLDGKIGVGLYTLMQYNGSLSGSLTNLTVVGTYGKLTNPPGAIALFVTLAPGTPSNLVATTLSPFQINLAWQAGVSGDAHFLIERSADNVHFTQIASVENGDTTYLDTGLSALTTYFYRVRASTESGGNSGYSNTASTNTTAANPLTWRGDGVANNWDLGLSDNWSDGTNLVIFGNGAPVRFDDTGSNNVPIELHGTLSPASVAVDASRDYVFEGSGSITGTNAFLKTSNGSLTINGSHTFSGGTTIAGGEIDFGSIDSNQRGLGTGPIRFEGGTLRFDGYGGNTGTDWGGNSNEWVVAAGKVGTVLMPPRFGWGTPFTSRLTGQGDLRVVTDYVRCGFGGDWSSFSGRILVGPRNNTADFRLNNPADIPSAALFLSNGITMYSIYGNNSTIDIGELSGDAGATLGPGNGSSSNPTWRVGGRNSDTTFAGRIIDAGVTAVSKSGSGTWTLTGASTYSGPTAVNAGTLLVNGDNSAAVNQVTVASAAALGGNGIVGGATSISGSLRPGDHGIGRLTFNQSVQLDSGSTTVIELNAASHTNDSASVAGVLTLSGTLSVNLIAGTPSAGDFFQLFQAAGFSGNFSGVDLPSLPAGLAWNASRLSVDGTLWVVSTAPPIVESAGIDGGDFVVSGRNGTPGWDYYVLSSTNVSLPLNQWSRVATNQFNAGGGFSFAHPADPSFPQRFYLIEVP